MEHYISKLMYSRSFRTQRSRGSFMKETSFITYHKRACTEPFSRKFSLLTLSLIIINLSLFSQNNKPIFHSLQRGLSRKLV